MKKAGLLFIAIVLWLLYTFCFIKWLQSGHTLTDVWKLMTSDWLLAITLFDTGIFTIFCFAWLIRDMRVRNYSAGSIVLAVMLTFCVGAASFIGYLAIRRPASNQKPGT